MARSHFPKGSGRGDTCLPSRNPQCLFFHIKPCFHTHLAPQQEQRYHTQPTICQGIVYHIQAGIAIFALCYFEPSFGTHWHEEHLRRFITSGSFPNASLL